MPYWTLSQNGLELWALIYYTRVCLCMCTWGGCESIWVCTQVSICAVFVCHSPLKLQLPSRHDFPLCCNQQTSQHLTNTSHQLSLLTQKRLQSFCWWHIETASSDKIFPMGTSHILTHLTYTGVTNRRCHWAATSPLVATCNETPHTFGHSSIFVSLLFLCFFHSFFFHSASPACTILSQREKALNTASN